MPKEESALIRKADGSIDIERTMKEFEDKVIPALFPSLTVREALISLSYTEARPGKWVKPIGFQAFTYLEATSEWTCWFKPADGGPPARMETKKFGSVHASGSYIRQLKEFEQWTKHDVYTDSQFELGAIDL